MRVSAILPIFTFLLVATVDAVDIANLAPSVDTIPYHKVNLAGDLIDSSGAGTQFVNFSSNYPASLSGNNILVTNAAGDTVALRA